MVKSCFTFLCLIGVYLTYCLPVMAVGNVLDGFADDDIPRRRGGRKPSPSRGLPANGDLGELARTYIECQHRLWPELVGRALPDLSDDSVNALSEAFEHRFLDAHWKPTALAFKGTVNVTIGAAYLRFSSENSNPRSLNQQLANCLNRAQQDGAFIPWDYVCADAAVSGTIVQRRGYQMAKALMACTKSDIKTLYIDELGRAGRYAIEALRLGQLIQKLFKRLVGASDSFDTNSEMSKMMLHLYAMLHEWFVDQLRAKVNRGMNDAFERGIDIGPAAFGYEMVPLLNDQGEPVLKPNGKPQRVRAINKGRATEVLDVFELYVNQKLSPGVIAADYNDRKVGGRNSWAPNTITDLLAREVYAGFEFKNKTRQFRDPETGKHIVEKRPRSEWKRRDVPHLQIVPTDFWESAQKRLADSSAAWAATHPDGGRATVYAKTLVRPICGSCGKELVLGHSGQSPSFCCINGRNHANGCEFRGYKMVSIVESAILDAVSDRIFTPDFEQRLLVAASEKLEEQIRMPQPDTMPLKAEIKKLKSRRIKLAQIIEEAGKTEVKALVERLKDCERRLCTLRKELKSVGSAATSVPPVPLTLLDVQESLGQLHELLRSDVAVAAPVLRQLTGPITVDQVSEPGKKRPTWVATFELNAVPVLAELTKKKKSPTAGSWGLLASSGWTISVPVRIPLVRRTKYEKLGPTILKQVEARESLKEIASQHGLSEALAGRILEFARTGVRPDWHKHARRPRLDASADSERPKYVQFAKVVMELHVGQNVPLSQIPQVIKEKYNEEISESTVTAAFKYAQTAAKYGGDLPDMRE